MPKPKVQFFTQPEMVSSNTLHTAAWNFKLDGDEDAVSRFDAALQASNVTPLHVAGRAESSKHELEVVDGNHRLERLRALGVKRIPVYNHGVLSLTERKALGLRYNGQWFQTHSVNLAKCLQDIEQSNASVFTSLPYSDADVEHALASLQVDTKIVPVFTDDNEEDMDTHSAPTEQAKKGTGRVKCPHCGKTFKATSAKKKR